MLQQRQPALLPDCALESEIWLRQTSGKPLQLRAANLQSFGRRGPAADTLLRTRCKRRHWKRAAAGTRRPSGWLRKGKKAYNPHLLVFKQSCVSLSHAPAGRSGTLEGRKRLRSVRCGENAGQIPRTSTTRLLFGLVSLQAWQL